MPSAKNVADAASRWADTGLSSPGSVFTPSLQAAGREAKRASEVVKYLAGRSAGKGLCSSLKVQSQKCCAKQAKNSVLGAGKAHRVPRFWKGS